MNDRIFSAMRVVATIALALALASPAAADTWGFVGARHTAMGGTGVAFADDSTATYWNPANLSLKKASDIQLPVTFGASIENNALEKLSSLIDRGDRARSALSDLDNGFILTTPQIDDISQLIIDLAEYGRNGEAVHVDLDLGLFGRHNGFGFQALSNTTGIILPNLDLSGIALSTSPSAISNFLGMLPAATPQNQALADEIAALGGGWTNAGADQFVAKLEDLGANTDSPAVADFISDIGRCTADPAAQGCNGLSANESGALASGLSTQEFGVSYGMKIPFPFFARSLLDRKFSIGATAKYMMGVTFVHLTTYSDAGSPGDVLTGLADLDRVQISHNFGLDLGLTWQPNPWVAVGVVARNVNAPKFSTANLADGTSLGDVQVDPQVRIGTALRPIEHMIISFDIDATENQLFSFADPNLDVLVDYGEPLVSRIVSIGTEYDIAFSRSIHLALRFGAFNNLSGSVNQDWALSGGLGLKLWQFYIDLAAGGSTESELIRTGGSSYVNLPTRLNAGLTLKWEKSI